jgi:hypothetical protein
MRKLLFIATAAMCAALAFGDNQFPTIPVMEKPMNQMSKEELKAFYEKRKAAIEALPPEQREAYRAKQKADRIAYAGGIVRKTDGKGRIVYANLQQTVETKDIAKTMDVLGKYLHVNIDTLDAKAEDVADVNKYLLYNKAKAMVIVVDNATDPSILVAPEDKWAKVNIGKFKDKNVKRRAQMELLRAFCYLCGGIGSEYNNPLTGFVGNPEQLDDSPVAELPIDVVNRFTPYLKQLGVIPYIETTYRKACREGWAPAPTNDVQKAIWEDINASKERGPANALQIPSPKKK